MPLLNNPFITTSYVSAEYFCNREQETAKVIRTILNGGNMAVISIRKMGKTALIQHCFHAKELSGTYFTFFVDIYATKSLRDFVFLLSKNIFEGLKPFGREAIERFLTHVVLVRQGVTFDKTGNLVFNVQLGDILNADTTLDEIFKYFAAAQRPCIIAINEFQQIANYPDKKTEALLHTHIRDCSNANFIFAGSQSHLMGTIFLSPERPFYQSVSIMHLDSIKFNTYAEFVTGHFKKAKKEIPSEVITAIYEQFRGVTWYVQKVLYQLYSATPTGGICDIEAVEDAICCIMDFYKYTYQEILFRMPEKQKELLVAIAKEDEVQLVTSGEFIKKYNLVSASSVHTALKGLLEKDFITSEDRYYRIHDQFLDRWLKENF